MNGRLLTLTLAALLTAAPLLQGAGLIDPTASAAQPAAVDAPPGCVLWEDHIVSPATGADAFVNGFHCTGAVTPADPTWAMAFPVRADMPYRLLLVADEAAADVELRAGDDLVLYSDNRPGEPEVIAYTARDDGEDPVAVILGPGSPGTTFSLFIKGPFYHVRAFDAADALLDAALGSPDADPPPPPPNVDCGTGADATADDPIPVTFGDTCHGRLAERDRDHFTLDVVETTVLAMTRAADHPVTIEVRDSDDRQVVYGFSFASSDVVRILAPGTYDIRVHQVSGRATDYTIDFGSEAFADTDDCGGPGDAPPTYHDDPWPGGRAVAVGVTCTGQRDRAESQDAFTFSSVPGTTTRVTLERLGLDPDARRDTNFRGSVYAQGFPGASVRTTQPDNHTTTFLMSDPAAVPWAMLASVLWTTSTSVPYRVTVDVVGPEPAHDDCGLGVDRSVDPDHHGDVVPVGGGCVAGVLAGSDVGDSWRLTAPDGAPAVVTATLNASDPIYVRLVGDGVSTASYTYQGPATVRALVQDGDAAAVTAHRGTYSNGGTITYDWDHVLTPWAPDDCGTGADAGDTPGTATDLTALMGDGGVACTGTVLPGDRWDHYLLPVEDDGFLEIDLRPAPGGHRGLSSTYVTFYDADTLEVVGARSTYSGTTFVTQFDGPVIMSIRGDVDYALTVTPSGTGWANDCATGRDASPDHPLRLEHGVPCAGRVENWVDEEDPYVVDLRVGDVVRVEVATDAVLTNRGWWSLHDPYGTVRAGGVGTTAAIGSGVFVADLNGDWTVVVERYVDHDYEVRVDVARPR